MGNTKVMTLFSNVDNLNRTNKMLLTGAMITLAMLMLFTIVSVPVFAAGGNPMTNLGNWLLDGLTILAAAVGLCMAVVSFVKGQTVKGIILLVVTGVVVFLASTNGSAFETIGQWLVNALGA